MSKGLYFVLGAAIGSAITWYITKTICDEQKQEEINQIKEVWSFRKEEPKAEESEKSEEPIKEVYDNPRQAAMDNANKPNIMEYTKRVQKEGYINYSDKDMKSDDVGITKPKIQYIPEPYAIPGEEFGLDDDFDTVSLTLYSDDILADDDDEIVEDVEEKVGAEFREYFGKYDDEVVWIRNEKLKVEYEICKDQSTYEEVAGQKPKRIELT